MDKNNSSKTHKNKRHEARGLYVMQNSPKSQESRKAKKPVACGSNYVLMLVIFLMLAKLFVDAFSFLV